MNKAELVEKVAVKAELSKKEAEAAVNALVELVEKALVKGEEVKLSGFGNFARKARAARVGTNPATGKKIQIPAAKAVVFKPAKALKEAVNK
jgi:DNA-binding protein HU-beta